MFRPDPILTPQQLVVRSNNGLRSSEDKIERDVILHQFIFAVRLWYGTAFEAWKIVERDWFDLRPGRDRCLSIMRYICLHCWRDAQRLVNPAQLKPIPPSEFIGTIVPVQENIFALSPIANSQATTVG